MAWPLSGAWWMKMLLLQLLSGAWWIVDLLMHWLSSALLIVNSPIAAAVRCLIIFAYLSTAAAVSRCPFNCLFVNCSSMYQSAGAYRQTMLWARVYSSEGHSST
jgi:hypothetical protein